MNNPEFRNYLSKALASRPYRYKPRKTGSKARKSRRLEREANACGSHTLQEWEQVKAEHNNRCLRCGSSEKILADHIHPLYRGGSNAVENIQPLCSSCNLWKGLKVIDFRPTYKIQII